MRLQSKLILLFLLLAAGMVVLTWVVVSRELVAELTAKILLEITLLLAVVFILAVFLTRIITTPIDQMAKTAREIREGNLEKRLPVTSNDEIGQLAETLNTTLDKLNEDIGKLKKLERVRTEFLGNVSHELRTPIFALQAAIETLQNGAVDDPAVNREFLDKAFKNARRLDTLLSDLIEISRIESGDMKMSFRYFRISEFLAQVVAELQPEAGQKNISLRYDSTGDDTEVYGDKERIKQALTNLIMNAIKYTDPGGSVNVRQTPDDTHVRVSVADTGCGIPAEHLTRIFERFYRVDRDRSRQVGGTGLGLAIVKHIIEAHGSHIEVASTPGTGSTFSFLMKR